MDLNSARHQDICMDYVKIFIIISMILWKFSDLLKRVATALDYHCIWCMSIEWSLSRVLSKFVFIQLSNVWLLVLIDSTMKNTIWFDWGSKLISNTFVVCIGITSVLVYTVRRKIHATSVICFRKWNAQVFRVL